MEKVLMSGCLIGQKVRYHGGDALYEHPIIAVWAQEGRIISICPEVSAGLPVPRPPCEIVGGDGRDVLVGAAKVISHTGIERTEAFILGANNALNLVKKHNIKIAILKSKSPSCGNTSIYDGTYSGKVKEGSGITAALLQENGIRVFNESEIDSAVQYLSTIDLNSI